MNKADLKKENEQLREKLKRVEATIKKHFMGAIK